MRLPGARLPVGEHRAVEAVEGPEDDVEGRGGGGGSERASRSKKRPFGSLPPSSSVSSSSSFSLSPLFSLFSLLSLILSTYLVDVLLRRVRAEDGVEGKLFFVFRFCFLLREVESPRGRGRARRSLFAIILIPPSPRRYFSFIQSPG